MIASIVAKGMRMNDCVHFRSGFQYVEMKTPLARRSLRGIERTVEGHINDLFRPYRFVGDACGRDQHPGLMTQADIA